MTCVLVRVLVAAETLFGLFACMFLRIRSDTVSIPSSTAKPKSRPILQKRLPKNATVQIGDNATMTCIVLISGTLPDLRWLKWEKSVLSITKIGDYLQNGSYRLIDPHYYKTIQVKDHYAVELRITNVTEDDFGLYTCFVSNHIGKDYNSAFLSKYVKPTAYVKGQ